MRSIEERRRAGAEASRRWRVRHPEQRKASEKASRQRHKAEIAAYLKRRRKAHPEIYRRYHRNHMQRIKTEVLSVYGGRCVCCGETELVFLSIDHMNGGGTKHRSADKGKLLGVKFYYMLKREGFPPGYQVLCFNCNFAKSQAGGCPHQGRKGVAKTPSDGHNTGDDLLQPGRQEEVLPSGGPQNPSSA